MLASSESTSVLMILKLVICAKFVENYFRMSKVAFSFVYIASNSVNAEENLFLITVNNDYREVAWFP